MSGFAVSWFPVVVVNDSMLPTLRPGDRLVVRPARPGEPRAGQIVFVSSPGRELVKRVVRYDGAGSLWLEGDNAARSTDSRSLGAFSRDQITGVVAARYWPPARLRVFL